MNGRNCDNCECHLDEEDFDSYGSWSYTCPVCEFKYSHSSTMTAREQVKKFNEAKVGDSAAGGLGDEGT